MGRSRPTRNDDILLIPREVSENCVESVGRIRDENDFVGSCADKLSHAMSGRGEVFGKVQFDESVDIPLYGLESSPDSSRNWDRNRTIGACTKINKFRVQQVYVQCMEWADHCSNSHNLLQSHSIVVVDGQTAVEGGQVGSSPRKPKGGKTNLPEANVTENARVRFRLLYADGGNEETHSLFTHIFIDTDMPCYCSSDAARLLYAERERLRTDDNTVGMVKLTRDEI